jgi:hypothetical protein
MRPASGESERFAARRREVMSKLALGLDPREQKDCGAPIGRVRCAKWAASRRPAYAAISQHRLPVPRISNDAKPTTPGIPPKACGSRTPEAGPLSCRRGSGLAICLGPLVSAGTSGAASQVPRGRRSAARVLMDEGWEQFTSGWRGGDKFVAHATVAPVSRTQL